MSEIMRLFGEWQDARHGATTAEPEDFPDTDAWEKYVEDCYCKRDNLELEMVKLTPATPAEVAAMVLATTQWGDEPLIGYGFGDQLVAKLMALAGCAEAPAAA